MKTIIAIFRRTILFTMLFISFTYSFSQPSSFTWQYRHTGWKNPISPAKNQGENGPCSIFAAVAGVEAMASLYYMLNGNQLILSESSIYNVGPVGGCTAITCGTGSVQVALDTMKSIGIVDNQYYSYSSTCRTDCQQVFSSQNYNYKINIPKSLGSQITTISDTTDLKKAIMDYGPVIVTMGGVYSNKYVTYYLYPGTSYNVDHSVLIIGWRHNPELEWHIKDSWHEKHSIYYRSTDSINIFNFSPTFYRVHPLDNSNNPIICAGDGCPTSFSNRIPEDHDGDGFYNWGIGPKPPNCPGINKMDVDDGDPKIIFRDGYNILAGPYISDTTSSKYICSNGKTFTLQNFDPLAQKGFTVNWNLTPAYYFTTSSGNTKTAVVTPYSSYYGKKCKLEYNLYKGDTLVTKYKYDFYINGPREDLVSTSVLDSYGGSPTKYGDTYYLCPNTNYTITYNNYDNSCTTSNFSWGLPYGWSKNWDYNHQVSINTNDNPDGFLSISALALYCNQNIQVLEPYFGAADCGDYFILYPNPAESSVAIDVIKNKFLSERISYDEECTLIVLDKTGISKNIVKFKGFPYTLDTSNLTEGLYFIKIQLNGKRSTIRLVIKPK